MYNLPATLYNWDLQSPQQRELPRKDRNKHCHQLVEYLVREHNHGEQHLLMELGVLQMQLRLQQPLQQDMLLLLVLFGLPQLLRLVMLHQTTVLLELQNFKKGKIVLAHCMYLAVTVCAIRQFLQRHRFVIVFIAFDIFSIQFSWQFPLAVI